MSISSYNGKGFMVQHWGNCSPSTDTGSTWKTLKEAIKAAKKIKKSLPCCDCDAEGFNIIGPSGKYDIQGQILKCNEKNQKSNS